MLAEGKRLACDVCPQPGIPGNAIGPFELRLNDPPYLSEVHSKDEQRSYRSERRGAPVRSSSLTCDLT